MVWDTKTTQVYEDNYLKNHQHEMDVLKWTGTQHALQDPEVTTLINTYEIERIRESDRVEDPIATAKQLAKIVDEIIDRAPTSDASIEDRELAIQSGQAVDLPSGSVRALRARLLNFKRKRKPNLKAAKRIIKQICCGAQIIKHKANDITGELTPTCKDTFVCKTPGCARPICHAQNTQNKKQAFNRDLKRLKQQNQGYRLIMVTLKTPWPLPKSERRHLPGYPTIAILGRGKPTIIRPGIMTKSAETNLLQHRLKEHEKARTKFINNKTVRDVCAQHTHYTTEFAFLTPSEKGHRTFPNPHTHFITAVTTNTDLNKLAETLTYVWKRTSKKNLAKVLISPLYADDASYEQENQSLDNYFKKTVSITPDIDGEENKPNAADSSAILDYRSLMEWLDLVDYDKQRKLSGTFNFARTSKHRTSTLKDFFLKPKRSKPRTRNNDYGINLTQPWDLYVESRRACLSREHRSLTQDSRLKVGRCLTEGSDSGGFDDGCGTEVGKVGCADRVLQPRVVPLGRLLHEFGDSARVPDDGDRSEGAVLNTLNVQRNTNQSSGPTSRVQEDHADLVPTDEDVGFVEEDLVHHHLVSRHQIHGPGELGRLSIFIESNDNLNGVIGFDPLSVNTETGLAGGGVAPGQRRCSTSTYDRNNCRPAEAEKVFAGTTKKATRQVRLRDEIGRELDTENLGGGVGVPECEGDSSGPGGLLDEVVINQLTSPRTNNDLTVDRYREETVCIQRCVGDGQGKRNGGVELFGHKPEVFVASEHTQHSSVCGRLFDDDGCLGVEEGEDGEGESGGSWCECDIHRGADLSACFDQ